MTPDEKKTAIKTLDALIAKHSKHLEKLMATPYDKPAKYEIFDVGPAKFKVFMCMKSLKLLHSRFKNPSFKAVSGTRTKNSNSLPAGIWPLKKVNPIQPPPKQLRRQPITDFRLRCDSPELGEFLWKPANRVGNGEAFYSMTDINLILGLTPGRIKIDEITVGFSKNRLWLYVCGILAGFVNSYANYPKNPLLDRFYD